MRNGVDGYFGAGACLFRSFCSEQLQLYEHGTADFFLFAHVFFWVCMYVFVYVCVCVCMCVCRYVCFMTMERLTFSYLLTSFFGYVCMFLCMCVYVCVCVCVGMCVL